jgi:hypothetical protein
MLVAIVNNLIWKRLNIPEATRLPDPCSIEFSAHPLKACMEPQPILQIISLNDDIQPAATHLVLLTKNFEVWAIKYSNPILFDRNDQKEWGKEKNTQYYC